SVERSDFFESLAGKKHGKPTASAGGGAKRRTDSNRGLAPSGAFARPGNRASLWRPSPLGRRATAARARSRNHHQLARLSAVDLRTAQAVTGAAHDDNLRRGL